MEEDVAVVADKSLKFHIFRKGKLKMLAITERTLQKCMERNVLFFLPLHKSFVRSYLEFTSSVRCPYEVKYKERIEKVPRSATELMSGLEGMSHKERL